MVAENVNECNIHFCCKESYEATAWGTIPCGKGFLNNILFHFRMWIFKKDALFYSKT